MVKDYVFCKDLAHVPAIKYGKDNEQTSIDQLSAKLNIRINRCGLFIDKEFPFLGATPDGIYDGGIVEVKCPSSAKNMSPDVAIREKKIKFWKVDSDGNILVNKSHPWHYQVQGQLRITGADKCIFCVWTGDNSLKEEVIERDDQFWKEKMEPKLVHSYYNC